MIAIAERSPHQRGERDDNVMGGDKPRHQSFIPTVAPHHIETVEVATFGECALPKHEVVHHGDGMAGGEQMRNESGAEVSGSAGDEDFVHLMRDFG